MKNKNIFFLFIILLIVFSIFLPYGYTSTKKTVYASRDSYISSYDREANYGRQTTLYCGTWGTYKIYEYETYMYFDLSLTEPGWNKVNLYLMFFSVPQLIKFDILRISSSWSEFTIKWDNKPKHDIQLLTFKIDDNGLCCIDVSSYVSRTAFSICICTTYDQYAWISSREVYYAWLSSREDSLDYNKPRLVVEYGTTHYNLGIGFIGFIVVITIIAIAVYVLINQQKKEKVCNQNYSL